MHLTSTGMVCSVGLSAPAACAAMRAGIAKFDELAYLDNLGQPIVGAAVPGVSIELKGEPRLIGLLAMAVSECLGERLEQALDTMPVLIGLAETGRPASPKLPEERFVSQLERKLGVRFHQTLSRSIPEGHTSGFRALQAARQLLNSGGISACLVCGVDSYLNAASLNWLDAHARLKTEVNSDGVIPGEAAAAVLVELAPRSGRIRGAQITGIGFSFEEAGLLTEKPLLGQGLAAAARQALAEAGLQLHDIDFRLSDMTGESYGFKEQALLLSRLLREHRNGFPVWHGADSIGDTGAAAGLCQLVVAAHAFETRRERGRQAICCTSAIGGSRSVTVIRAGASAGE